MIKERNPAKIAGMVRALREKAGISQEKLADLLKVSRPTISQIESGQRKISADDLVRLSNIFHVPIGNLVEPGREPKVVFGKKEKTKEPKLEFRISVPQKNLEKFKEVLLYILNKVGSKPNIGETVIYKLLYFVDFNFYEKYEEQLIGATYLKNKYGPTPIEFKKVLDKMLKDKEIEKVNSQYFEFPQTKYLPLRTPDLTRLKANEVEVIDGVLNRLSDMNAAQISDYSHKDIPFLTTEDGKAIKYEAVFYRTPTYSVREYDEDDD